MSSELIEGQMLAALEVELAKIGTDPDVDWLTTPAPLLKLGVPGDPIKSPNRCSLYLQNLGSQLGRDEIGTNPLRLDGRFAIWCASSHPADAQRRMLNLAEDVRRALLAAEDTFYDQFRYGLELGTLSFTGDEMYVRAGIAAASFEVQIGAEASHDGQRLGAIPLSVDLERTLLRIYPFSALTVQERASGVTQTLEPPAIRLETSVVGANKYFEGRVEGHPTDQWFESPSGADWMGFESEIACQVGPYFNANPSDSMFAGIEMGSFDQAPPFPAIANSAVAQLRWNYGLLRWELVSGVGDGTTPVTIVPLTGIPTMVAGGGARIRLIYDPFTPKLIAMMNGVVGAEITDPTKLPKFASFYTSLLHHGIFVTSGSHASATVQALFSAFHAKLYNHSLPPATLWYS